MRAEEIKRQVPIERLVEHYGGALNAKGEGRCLCADRHNHGDRDPSMGVRNGYVRCWSQGCFGEKGADIFALVGVMEGLAKFADQRRRVLEIAGLAGKESNGKRILRTYRWADHDGNEAYKLRWDTEEPGKKCTWAQDAQNRQPGLGRCRPTLRGLSEIERASRIVLCEGESDQETVNALLEESKLLGNTWATTSAHGAGDVKAAYLQPLLGKACVLLSGDNDLAGQGYIEKCGRLLHGKVERLLVLRVSDGHKDWREWLRAGGTADQFTALMEAAPSWTPNGTTQGASQERVNQKDEAAQPERSSKTDRAFVQELADELLRDDWFAQNAGRELYVYQAGVYRPVGAEHVRRRVKGLLVEGGDAKHWSRHRTEEVVEFIRVDAPCLWERPSLDRINLTNGLLELGACCLRPHDPQHLCPVQLPVAYDPAARCEAIETFVGQVFPDDCRELAHEIAGDLIGADRSIQKAVLLQGDGEAGKSTFLRLLTALIGRENAAALSLQQLETDRFAVARLLGKLANICPDLPGEHLASTSMFKRITGGDRLTAEQKFRDSFEFAPFCRLVFSANHYPQSRDSSEAFFRRWVVIPFLHTFTGSDRKDAKALDAALHAPQELSGFLNKALEGWSRVQQRRGFTETESTRQAWTEFQDETDPVATWLRRSTTADPKGMVSKKDLLIAYNADAESRGRPVLSPHAVTKAIKRLRPDAVLSRRTVLGEFQDVWLGLVLRTPRAAPDQVPAATPNQPVAEDMDLYTEEITKP